MEAIEMEDESNLHRFIFEKKIKKILEFVESNPFQKVVVFNGDSAIAWSLKCGDLDVYEVLVANDFKLAVSENFAEILRNLDLNPKVEQARKLKLREIHRMYMKETSKKHLFRLNLMSKLAPTTLNDNIEKYEENIVAMFDSLAKIPNIELIMKFVSRAKGELVELCCRLTQFSPFQVSISTLTSKATRLVA
jgi:hypothetical protein